MLAKIRGSKSEGELRRPKTGGTDPFTIDQSSHARGSIKRHTADWRCFGSQRQRSRGGEGGINETALGTSINQSVKGDIRVWDRQGNDKFIDTRITGYSYDCKINEVGLRRSGIRGEESLRS